MGKELEHLKDRGTGHATVVTFKMKVEHLAVLDELLTLMPKGVNRSDLIRDMLLPYCSALLLAKEGKPWTGALELGKGLIRLKEALKLAQQEASQEDFTAILDHQPSVLEVPKT